MTYHINVLYKYYNVYYINIRMYILYINNMYYINIYIFSNIKYF